MSAQIYHLPNNPEQKHDASDVYCGRPQAIDQANEGVQKVQRLENQAPPLLPADTYGEAAQEALRAAEQTGIAEVIDLTKARLLAESLAKSSIDNPNLYKRTETA